MRNKMKVKDLQQLLNTLPEDQDVIIHDALNGDNHNNIDTWIITGQPELCLVFNQDLLDSDE
tara:strand:- start:2470 stop:2655 length:186 start_codon:yes stop_codon:yes gene_type:complete